MNQPNPTGRDPHGADSRGADSHGADPIYLDHNATTPVDARVLAAMVPLFTDHFANPSSTHRAGREVAALVTTARERVAALVGAHRRGVVFTSGATESANLALRGALAAAPPGRRRILLGATEHRAVLAAAGAAAAAEAGTVQTIRVHPDGTLDLDHLAWLLDASVAVVAVMAANNETGVIHDVAEVADLVHRAGAVLCSDLTQAAGRIPVPVTDLGADLALLSAHKLYGPKGVGALVVGDALRRRLPPLIVGGDQERGLRGGTLNSAGIVGFGVAAQLAAAQLRDGGRRQRELVRLLHTRLAARVRLQVVGEGAPRLPNTLNVRLVGAPSDAVLAAAPRVLAAPGSACQSASEEPSHVLLAMGLAPDAALQCVRFSLGRDTTEEQIRAAADLIADAVTTVRRLTGADDVAPLPPATPQNSRVGG